MDPPDNYSSWSSTRAHPLRLADYPTGVPVHVTICTEGGRSHLRDHRLASAVQERLAQNTETIAAVIMPDHLHWLLRDASRMMRVVPALKAWSTRVAWRYGVFGRLWQRSYFDSLVRDRERLRDVVRYLLANPVRAGLAAESNGYRWFVVFPERME